MNSRSSLICALPPLCACVAVGFMIAPKRWHLHEIDEQTTMLRERVAQAESRGRPAGGRNQSLVEQMGAAQPSDIVTKLEKVISGYGKMTTKIHFSVDRNPAEMSIPELLATLDRLKTADIEGRMKSKIQESLAEHLLEKSPEVAVKQLFERDLDPKSPVASCILTGFSKWLKSDYDSATAWLHEREAAGDFETSALDGKMPMHLRLMTPVTRELLTRDPEAAERWLASLPQEHRLEVLEARSFIYRASLSPTELATYAGIIRRQLSDGHSRRLIERYAYLTSFDGYEEVEAFASQINPTPDERRAMASQVVEAILDRNSSEDPGQVVAELNQWLSGFAPAEAPILTGRAVAKLYQKNPEQQISAIEQLHALTGSDDLLQGFLESSNRNILTQHGHRLVEKIKDPTKRATALERMNADVPSTTNPAEAR